MKSVFDRKEDCCGCTACYHICQTNAISMVADTEGFLYPQINREKCIDCGKCREVCPIINDTLIENRLSSPKVFAVKHRSDKVRMGSSSGGAYTGISDYVLDKKGCLYGARFGDGFEVIHAASSNVSGRDEFRGSKYVQSYLGEVFSNIAEDLRQGRTALFSGTGCQVAGLANYLRLSRVDTDKLLLNDIICHGVPSPKLWRDHINHIQKRNLVVSYTFRDKQLGWRGYNVKACFSDHTEAVNTRRVKSFIRLFNSNLMLRPSCYQCRFCSTQRFSDIMIGDFWGIENSLPEIDDNKGVSLAIVSTQKGMEALNGVRSAMDIYESNIEKCLQHNLVRATNKPANREAFWKDYKTKGFEFIAKKYGGLGLRGIVKGAVVSSLRRSGLLKYVKRQR